MRTVQQKSSKTQEVDVSEVVTSSYRHTHVNRHRKTCRPTQRGKVQRALHGCLCDLLICMDSTNPRLSSSRFHSGDPGRTFQSEAGYGYYWVFGINSPKVSVYLTSCLLFSFGAFIWFLLNIPLCCNTTAGSK